MLATLECLDTLRAVTPYVAWLNPMPEARWRNTSAEVIARQVAMFSMSPDGLSNAVDVLRGLRPSIAAVSIAMPTSDDSRARQTVEHFIALHEPGYEPLLYYAALPLILTPELLHYLRHEFTPTTPWIAEVDILLAESLCRQYSTYEQYLLHADIRAWLLETGPGQTGLSAGRRRPGAAALYRGSAAQPSLQKLA